MRLLNVFCFFTAITVLAGSTYGQLEDRLSQLQRTYEREVEKATAPVDRKYYQALVALQKSLIDANNLEKALVVKKEIDALLSKAGKKSPPAQTNSSTAARPSPEPSNNARSDLKKWRGDMKLRQDEGEDVLVLEGVQSGTRKMRLEVDVEDDFPNGLRMRFQYKSDGLPGGGLEIRGDHPSTNGFTYRNPTLILDGAWHEYEWPFSEYKGERKISFEFHVENSDGEMKFRNIEFLEP